MRVTTPRPIGPGVNVLHSREIPHFPGWFAGEDGRIYSQREATERLITYRIVKGYAVVTGRRRDSNGKRGDRRKHFVHRLVLSAWSGEPPFEDAETRHLDGNRLNNSPDNLKWGTTMENHRDAVSHGTAISVRRGLAHPRGRLSDADVASIRLSSDSLRSIADRFGITSVYVARIQAGRVRQGAGGNFVQQV